VTWKKTWGDHLLLAFYTARDRRRGSAGRAAATRKCRLQHGRRPRHRPGVALETLRPSSAPRTILANPEDFATEHTREFNALFASNGTACRSSLAMAVPNFGRSSRMSPPNTRVDNDRKKLLSRYLGFSLWDGMIFPIISFTELPQFTPMDVAQFPPFPLCQAGCESVGGQQGAWWCQLVRVLPRQRWWSWFMSITCNRMVRRRRG
jgi:hypothetical protein